MADENLNDAPEENANPNGTPSENAQQALDDLTVLSDVGNQSMGDSRLNLVRNVDVSDAALGGLANVHQGSGTGNQVQQGLEVQAGLVQGEEIVVEQAPVTPVEPPEVPPTEPAADESAGQEIIDTAVNLGIQEDLSVANIIFGEGIPTSTTGNGGDGPDVPVEDLAVEDVVQDVIPAATLEDAFVDSLPVFGGIRIDLNPDDNDPTLTPVPSPVPWTEDKNLIFGVDASDPDGGDVIITFDKPAHGTMEINGDGTYTYKPDANYYGDDSFTIFVTDDEGNVVSQVVEVNIAAVEDDAVITVTGGTGTESTTDAATVVTGQVVATDVDNLDGSAPAYSFGTDVEGNPILTQATAHGSVTIDAETGAYTFTASDNNWAGSDTFTVTTTDSLGGTSTFEVPVTVVASDDATVVDGPVTLDDMLEDGTITITSEQLLAKSHDSDNTLHVENLQVSGGELVDNGDGTWTFTPDADFNGSLDLTYDVVTDTGVATPASATLDVTAVDDSTVVTGPTSFEMNEDGTITLTPEQLLANSSDIDSALSVANVTVDGGTL
ncbi:MAG: tandem-95 repeat protein, partial [Magnetospirillum sp.]